MILELTFAAFVLGQAYHRYLEATAYKPPTPLPAVGKPRVDEGAPALLLYGRCRVRSPILAWFGHAKSIAGEDIGNADGNPCPSETDRATTPYFYMANMLFVVGIPFLDGTNLVHAVWAGDMPLTLTPILAGTPPTGAGEFEAPFRVESEFNTHFVSHGFIGGYLEPLDGNSSQRLVDAVTFDATNETGRRLKSTAPGGVVPGYRGFMTALLWNGATWDGFTGSPWSFFIGPNPQPPAFSFEASSYPAQALHLQKVGDDANPADVIWDLLTGMFGKLGLPENLLDYESFRSAAETLHSEGHGYSMVIDKKRSVGDVVMEILRQIDGVLYEDPITSLITLKLIRADFRPRDVPLITVDNCEKLSGLEVTGWTGVYNRIRVKFTDRLNGYAEGSATAQNHGNAVAQQDDEEIVLQFPGVTTQALANALAARELSARSRPLMRCTAIVSMELDDLRPGDPVALSWPEYSVSGRIFRVATVSLGGRDDNKMTVELVEDFFYTHRMETTDTTGLPSHPGAIE